MACWHQPNPNLTRPGRVFMFEAVLWIRIRPSSSKKVRIAMIFIIFCVFFYDFLSSKTDVNVPSTSNKKKKFLNMFFDWHLESHWRKEHDPDPQVSGTDPQIPHPFQNVTDPQHWFEVMFLFCNFDNNTLFPST